MSLQNPFDPESRLHGCTCGRHADAAAHAAAESAASHRLEAGNTGIASAARPDDPTSPETLRRRALEVAALRAVFPADAARRRFLKTVGAGGAYAVLASIFPFSALETMAAEAGGAKAPLEKKDLKVGFIPITCATPIIMAHPLGFYKKYGLNVEVIKTAGWAVVRDKALNKEYDAAHMLSPMPLAITLGAGSAPTPYYMPAVENINGQAITLSMKHKDKRDPKQWKGFKFAVPFDYSMHNFLLRYYLAEHGLNPDTDVQIRAIPPPEMVANLRADNVDGYLAPDPFNQRAVFEGVGFIHMLTKEIWDGHPCCAFAASQEFATTSPNTFAALFKSIVDATHYAAKKDKRAEIAKAIAPKGYLNQPEEVLTAVLTGEYDDGLGNRKSVPDRIDFNPYPWHSMAVWILTQMKRWGYIQGDVDYKKIAEQVYLAADCGKLMKELGYAPPAATYAKHVIMGKEFDPAKPAEYLKGFKIAKG